MYMYEGSGGLTILCAVPKCLEAVTSFYQSPHLSDDLCAINFDFYQASGECFYLGESSVKGQEILSHFE